MTAYYIGGRQSGKTLTLLRLMEADPSIIMVCADRATARETHRIGEANGILIDRARFVTPTEVHSRKPAQHRQAPHYVVDNVNLVLERMLGGTIDAITGTGYPRTPPLAQPDVVAAMLKDI